MLQIDRVEVRYFRSVYHATLKDLGELSVLSGPNDIGKSNILKALNLFFNNQTDWNTPFGFGRDFNQRRLDVVRKDSIKGKQYIKITVRFIRGSRYEKSLPERFNVSKTWYRDSASPDVTDDLERWKNAGKISGSLAAARGSLKRYLGTIRYEYIPAVRDSLFYTYLLEQLQYRVLENRSGDNRVDDLIRELNAAIGDDVRELSDEFLNRTGVPTTVRLPDELSELFRSFAVATTAENDRSDFRLPLSMRGDGIQARFLPSLLNFASQQSKYVYLWGFEEPENSLEHMLATRLAEDIENEYTKNAQILLTSHSPAFIALEGASTSIYRVYADGVGTNSTCIAKSGIVAPFGFEGLAEDLGLADLARQYQSEVRALLEASEAARSTAERIVDDASRPVLLTEGAFDVRIIEAAWARLHPTEDMPFRAESCDTNPDDASASAAGSTQLKTTMSALRPGGPLTIGLFDNDNEGRKQWTKLPRLFRESNDLRGLKLHRNGTAAALLLPGPASRHAWLEAKNLEIEHLFTDAALGKKVGDAGLSFEPMVVRKHVHEFDIDMGSETLSAPQFQKIVRESKKSFVTAVLPTLEDSDFDDFRLLFDAIESIQAAIQHEAPSVGKQSPTDS